MTAHRLSALAEQRPALAIAVSAGPIAATAGWLAWGIAPIATCTATIATAAYSSAAVLAWHRSLRRKRLASARREAADTVAYLAADLAAGTDPRRAVAAIEADWPRGADRTAHRLTTAWTVATELGAPAAELCRRLADHLREDEQAAAKARAQTAAIHATAALLTALPVAGIALGEALGLGALAFLLATWPGIACLAFAMVLQAAGLAWTRALINGVGTEAV
jgi:tight adherence protein B